ncbi:MAG: hypothetical protein AAGA44_01135 [Pseudomonadota bacterium]
MTDRRITTALLAIASMAATGTAAAQESVIERCKQTSSKDDRIACLEAALMIRESVPSISTGTPPASEHAITGDLPAVEMTFKDTPADVSAAPGPEVTKPVNNIPEMSASSTEVEETTDEQPQGIGAEQVIARQQTQEERFAALQRAESLEVDSYRELAFGRLQITLRDGQVWEQIKGDTRKVRVDLRRNQTVTIQESSLGGYKLRLNEMRREIRVRRIR